MHKIEDLGCKDQRVVNISSLSNDNFISTLGTDRSGHSKLESANNCIQIEGVTKTELKKQMLKQTTNLCFKKKSQGKDGADRHPKPTCIRDILTLKLKETTSKRAAHTPSVDRKIQQSRTTYSSLSLSKASNIHNGTKRK